MRRAYTMFPEKEKSIRMPCKYTFLRRLPTTWNRIGGLCNCLRISLCETGKFYCEINYFIYELTSRLLRDKFFYLRVEFFLLPREFFLVARELFFVRMRIYFHPHEKFSCSHDELYSYFVIIIMEEKTCSMVAMASVVTPV